MNSKQSCAAVALFVLAGVYTEKGFMDPLKQELSLRLRNWGVDVKSVSLYPYGDWTRRLGAQLWAILRDYLDIRERFWNSLGVRATQDDVFREAKSGKTVLLIGHSGGGVTALQIAGQLIKAGVGSPLIVQIGSPKCPVPADLKERVLFLYAAAKNGKCRDPIARLGRWSGWVRGVRGAGHLPKWKWNACAPDKIAGIPLLGGHADYFRAFPPYIDKNGSSNLDQTLQPLLSWLGDKLRQPVQ